MPITEIACHYCKFTLGIFTFVESQQYENYVNALMKILFVFTYIYIYICMSVYFLDKKKSFQVDTLSNGKYRNLWHTCKNCL
jgi:hypothetical protein